MRRLKAVRQDETALRGYLSSYFADIADLPRDPYNTQLCELPDEEVSGLNDPLRKLLKRYLPSRISYGAEERLAQTSEFIRGTPPRKTSAFVDALARFILAVIGGASLIVPMIIMTLHPSQAKSLITTSVAVIFFSFFMSVGIKSTNQDTLGATAAYAAVLVVFVGTSSS
jgi:hypothetical protein